MQTAGREPLDVRLERHREASRLFGLNEADIEAESAAIRAEYAPMLLCSTHRDAWDCWQRWAGYLLPDSFTGRGDAAPVLEWLRWRHPRRRRLNIWDQVLAIATGASEAMQERRASKNGKH